MNNFLKTIQKKFKKDDAEVSITTDNSELIRIYHQMRDEWKLIPEDEPNYALARKVFMDFNEFQQKGSNLWIYREFIPQSLLPYPKNYIKCAYYIFLDFLKKEGDQRTYELVQNIGAGLFTEYPNYEKYQDNLKNKSWYDDVVFKDDNPSPREVFKKLYGSYQILKEEYNASPNSIDATKETMIYDFGVLPEIEEDVDLSKIANTRDA